MIRTLIIDDEEDARVTLRHYLEHFCEAIQVVGEADSVVGGLAHIRTLKPDLVFLDVRLSPGSGFDILEQLAEVPFAVIFVTAHDEYAVKAIRFSAMDYLLKPPDIDELQAAVLRVAERQKEREVGQDRFEIFKATLNEQFNRMVLPTTDGFEVINLADIVRCEADRNYTHFFFQGGRKLTIPRTLKIYSEMLEPQGFARTHQSHLLNLNSIVAYKRRKKGGIAILQDGSEIPVSESRKDDFMARFVG